MAVRDRVRKYRQTGGASDLVRVEVLVPSDRREDVLATAASMRAEHRARKQRIDELCRKAVNGYGVRLFDNIDLSRLDDPLARAGVIASALMERGDARAFVIGRKLLAELER